MSQREAIENNLYSERADLFVAVDGLAKQVARLRDGLELARTLSAANENSLARRSAQSSAVDACSRPYSGEHAVTSDSEPKQVDFAEEPHVSMQPSDAEQAERARAASAKAQIIDLPLSKPGDAHPDKESSIASRIADLRDQVGGFIHQD